jgi:hypothetical protein
MIVRNTAFPFSALPIRAEATTEDEATFKGSDIIAIAAIGLNRLVRSSVEKVN